MVWAFVASLSAGLWTSVAVPIGLVFDIPVSVFVFLGTFATVFYFLTRSTIRYMQKLSEGLTILAEGNLRYRFPAGRNDELGNVAEKVNEMAEKLESLIEKERRVEKSKMELITGVSHDLRTPLTSILGYLQLLKDKAYKDEEEFARFLGNTHNKAVHLKTLIDELFDYARLSLSEAKLEPETIDLRAMLGQMLAETEPLAKDERISLEATLPENPVTASVDPEKLRRAIDNLLANALKYSEKPGTVRVSLEAEADSVGIAIENRGKAIGREQAERLFERFYKAEESRSDPAEGGGAGLGLAIARGIAELHGGRAYLDYEDGRFRFVLALPREASR